MRVLLLGAGFSRNWGGWLASEVMGELCGRLADDGYLLQLLRKTPNFETVYGQVRQEATRNPPSDPYSATSPSSTLSLHSIRICCSSSTTILEETWRARDGGRATASLEFRYLKIGDPSTLSTASQLHSMYRRNISCLSVLNQFSSCTVP